MNEQVYTQSICNIKQLFGNPSCKFNHFSRKVIKCCGKWFTIWYSFLLFLVEAVSMSYRKSQYMNLQQTLICLVPFNKRQDNTWEYLKYMQFNLRNITSNLHPRDLQKMKNKKRAYEEVPVNSKYQRKYQ